MKHCWGSAVAPGQMAEYSLSLAAGSRPPAEMRPEIEPGFGSAVVPGVEPGTVLEAELDTVLEADLDADLDADLGDPSGEGFVRAS